MNNEQLKQKIKELKALSRKKYGNYTKIENKEDGIKKIKWVKKN